jgi:hypothetical protein
MRYYFTEIPEFRPLSAQRIIIPNLLTLQTLMGGAALVPATAERMINRDTLKHSYFKVLIPRTPLEQSRAIQKQAGVFRQRSVEDL